MDTKTVLKNGEPQHQLSKEFVRQWLIENGFQGKEGQNVPEMSDDYIARVSERYIELYEKITGETFQKAKAEDVASRIEKKCDRISESHFRINLQECPKSKIKLKPNYRNRTQMTRIWRIRAEIIRENQFHLYHSRAIN
ncbi:hypothetical protein [Anaerophaga thermohalophila]|uniref:hypothetical protein n=1 Tax=Anaerophaga thermohalophila TaxID=177400 RepID=UPI00031CD9A0|nr:hypothetical protein [Anaerophaga thermohalophila]